MNSETDPGEITPPADSGLTREQAGNLMRLATYASVAVAITLIGAKLVAWFLTDSVSLLSSLMDSVLDAGASIINLLAVRHALQPADREHRFGHGKAEPLAGLAQAAFISGSAVFLLVEAGRRIIEPQAIRHPEAGIGVMLFSVVLTGALVLFQRYVVRKTASVAISADSLHYQTDLLMNVSVIVSLVLAFYAGFWWADPLFAVGIAGYICWGAWQIAGQSLNILMDRELPDEDRLKIREIALGHAEVRDLHDLRTRSAGHMVFIQLHLEMDPELTLVKAHDIAEEVMCDLEAAFPNAEVIIHQDPEGVDERVAVFK